MMAMTQGKCPECRIGIRWQGLPHLKAALCPHCLRPLRRTNYLLRWPWHDEVPMNREDKALQYRNGAAHYF